MLNFLACLFKLNINLFLKLTEEVNTLMIGYEAPYENDEFKEGVYIDNNILYIITFNSMNDFIDLEKVINSLEIPLNLEGMTIYGNQEEVLNIDILKLYTNLKYIDIRNVEVRDLNWLVDLKNIEYLKISSTMGLDMKGSLYHPIRYLTKLKKLDVSFSSFSDEAIYISKDKSIFDKLFCLEYLNLRETNIKDTSFLSLIKSKSLLLNFTDNTARLDFNQYDTIQLVTLLPASSDGSLMDISKYIGSY